MANVLNHRTFIHTFAISNCEQMFDNNSQLLYEPKSLTFINKKPSISIKKTEKEVYPK